MIDLKDNEDIEIDGDHKRDFEGVAFDPTAWREDDMNVYVVHEGADDDEPILFKLNYEYDTERSDQRCASSLVSVWNSCMHTGQTVV